MSIINNPQISFGKENPFLSLTKTSTSQAGTPSSYKTSGAWGDNEIGNNLANFSQNNNSESRNNNYSENSLYDNSFFDSDILDLSSQKTGVNQSNFSYSDISAIFGNSNSSLLNFDSSNPYSAITSAITQAGASAAQSYGGSDNSGLSSMISNLKGMSRALEAIPPQPRSSDLKKCKNGLYKDKSTGIYYQKDKQNGWYVQVSNTYKRGHK